MFKLLIKLFIKNPNDVNNPTVRKKYGFLSAITGICLNLLLFVGKLIVGILTFSISIQADAFNNLSDAGSSLITLVGFKLSTMPPDKEHPFGHGRFEYVASLVVSLIILVMGFELLKTSIEKIITPVAIEFSYLSLIILGIAVIVKLWMFIYNRGVAKKINSTAMLATANDSISDVCATSAVMVGVLIFKFFGVNLDAYIGILVSAFILFTGLKTAKESLSPLLGQKPDKELVDDIEKTILSYEEVVGVHDLIVHDYGVGVKVVSVHTEVPCKMDSIDAHELIDKIEVCLCKKYNCHATIHMDPVANDDEETLKMKAKVKELVKKIDEELSIHDFRKTKGIHQENLIFDVVVPFKFRMSDEEVVTVIATEIKKINKKYQAVISVDKKMC